MKLRDLLNVTYIDGNNVSIFSQDKKLSVHKYIRYECSRNSDFMEECKPLLNDEVIRFNIYPSAIDIYLK